jgi:peptide/nickel transport system substrate-binding protein
MYRQGEFLEAREVFDNLSAEINRRNFLGAGAAATAGLLLTACGSSSPSSSGGTTTKAATSSGPRKRGGTIRVSPSDFASATTMDPNYSAPFALATLMYDTLLWQDHDFKTIHPALAEEFEPDGSDLSTWIIKVRPGVEWHDGKPLTADDVIFSIKRMANPKTPGFIYGFLTGISQISKVDKMTVKIKLSSPNSQFRWGFVQDAAAMVPVGFNPKKPVGTGPYKYVSFTPGQQLVTTRNDNYWRGNGAPYLDGVTLLGFQNTDTARFNALISGQIDALDRLLTSQVSQVKSHSGLELLVSQTGSFAFTEMRTGKGCQFEDNRVRTAFKLMLDRQQFINEVYGGYGALGNDIGTWSQFDPSLDPNLPQRQQDLEQAKSLLKAAGKDGMNVLYRVAEYTPGNNEIGDIMIQQAKAIGVNVKINAITNIAQMYGSSSYETGQFKLDQDYTQSVFMNASYCWLPGSLYNNTNYNNPKLNSLFKQAIAQTGSKFDEMMGEVSKIIYEDGPWLVWGRQNLTDAYSNKFTGYVPDAVGSGMNGWNWWQISQA